MRLLGLVETYTKDGYLIVKPYVREVFRTVKCDALDSSGRKIGVIVDVIGRVDDPRVVVRLVDRDLAEFYAKRNERLYYAVARKSRKKPGAV